MLVIQWLTSIWYKTYLQDMHLSEIVSKHEKNSINEYIYLKRMTAIEFLAKKYVSSLGLIIIFGSE